MEIRDWAYQILSSERLEDKLFAPVKFSDEYPGVPCLFKQPARTHAMRFQRRAREEKLPALQELKDPSKVAVCLHRFAGHELLAVEIMAYVLLAFPEAPKSFRKGVAHVLKEEQEHVRLYMERLSQMGVSLGDMPLYEHFWHHTPYITSPLHYISVMSLTFEMANLDFAPIYGKTFLKAGDQASGELMATIFRDEINHVRFGWKWLTKWADGKGEWDAWEDVLKTTLLNPKRARGFILNQEPRLKAGISPEFIANLEAYSSKLNSIPPK